MPTLVIIRTDPQELHCCYKNDTRGPHCVCSLIRHIYIFLPKKTTYKTIPRNLPLLPKVKAEDKNDIFLCFLLVGLIDSKQTKTHSGMAFFSINTWRISSKWAAKSLIDYIIVSHTQLLLCYKAKKGSN